MKRIGCLIALVLVANYAFTQTNEYECVSCKGNEISFENLASGVGLENIATGKYSFAGGTKSLASNSFSFAYGLEAKSEGLSSFALGNGTQSLGMYSLAIGRGTIAAGDASFALGYMNLAQAESSYLFGEFLKSTAGGSVTIGIGAGTGSNYLKNNKAYSLMVGFNSIYPTFFVNGGSGTYKTGKVGIGNITTPTAKLHILGDNDPANANDASLFIQSAGNYNSSIWLGDMEHSIVAKPGTNITFHTSTGSSFVFENGNVGIGTNTPNHLLEINGDFYVTSTSSMLGNVGIGTSVLPTEKLVVNGNISQTAGYNITTNQIIAPDTNGLRLSDQDGLGIFVTEGGNVGIGTESPGVYKLAVNGKILAEELKIVESVPSSDYVFEKEYNLMTINKLEDFITKNKHLPEVPSAKEFEANGYSVGEMDDILLRKIEELTLYIIQQQKEIEKLKSILLHSKY